MRGACTLALAASLVGFASASAQQPKPPSSLPADIVDAWENAGAKAGWMDLQFRSDGDEGKLGEIPAFQFKDFRPGVFARLPEPGHEFGLSFFCLCSHMTDARLKELAELKFLETLDLGCTHVTDAGLKELASLKSLRKLDLF